MDQLLPDQPVGVHYGTLDNGLRYYVCCNSKPHMRAALALAVTVGSVLEEEDERGVAHIVEKDFQTQISHYPKYAERLPIGLERVIRTVSPETVKNFYKKWYHLCNMAVIAVGDFPDAQVPPINSFSMGNRYSNFCSV